MKKNNKPYSAVKTVGRLLKDLKPIAWALVIAAVVCCASVALSMIGPQIIGELTDIIYNFSEGAAIDGERVITLCLWLLGVYCATALCSLLTIVLMTNITSRFFTCGMRIRISKKLQFMPISFVDNTPNGELLSRMMNDVGNMSNSVHVLIEMFITGIIKLAVITYLLFSIHPLMATAVVVLVPLSLLLSAYISNKSEKCWHDYRKVNGRLYAFIEEDYTGFDTVKAFNLEARQKKLSDSLTDEYADKVRKGYYVSGLVQPIMMFTNNIAYVAVCLLGGYFVIHGDIDVGDVVKIILYAKLFDGPLESIASGMSSIHRTLACASRVYALLDHEEMSPAQSNEVPNGNGDVELRGINFSYVKDKPLIKNLNLSVKAGQKVAIVGPTGGGKTTIVNLLMRFYEPDEGSIIIDGVDVTKIDRAKLRSQFGMVLQDTWLFSGTVYDNIAYGKENATRQEVMQAAKQAHIDYFIDSLPNGYDTVINEESTNISGGQKQLLTIARAYLANRKMLILDEATSNVDTRTELIIQKTMDELMKGRTSFVIAHRLSTIVNADVILVVNDGEVVEKGTHAQLMAQKGFYSEIYNSQYELLK
ncbi:MAG: ABC transporter ATP-binding protein/permease [Corallococcus sp.]|nr:ABC transporter ATP-binding protein/permease [Corallococcus sp.]